jgi:molybdenum cofactor biosynthesis enzyme MoaA
LTSRLGALASLADEIKFNIDTVNIADYETIKKLPYERVYENLLMARERCQNIKINTPFVSIENAASLTDFSLDTGLEVRFIELLYGNLAEPSPKLSQLDGYLRERGYKIHKSGLRKIATKDKSTITLLRCYCREAVLTDDAEQATKLCRANTDLYITPRGELKPCIFGKTRIPIYKSVIDGNIELLQERFDDFDTLFGYGLCLDAIAERQYEKRAAQYV